MPFYVSFVTQSSSPAHLSLIAGKERKRKVSPPTARRDLRHLRQAGSRFGGIEMTNFDFLGKPLGRGWQCSLKEKLKTMVVKGETQGLSESALRADPSR
jgi:hypothetical protein